MSEIHPLDRVDDELSGYSAGGTSPGESQSAHRSKSDRLWLYWLVRVAIVVGVLLILSSVAMNNFVFESGEYWVAFVLNRFLMFILLMCFVGVLIIYQKSNLLEFIQRLRAGSTASTVDSQASAPSGSRRRPFALHRVLANRKAAPMILLVVASALILAIVWLLVLINPANPGMMTFLPMTTSLAVLPGLLICMIVWHRGYVRAYAIGALTTNLSAAIAFLFTIGPSLRFTRGVSGYSGEFWAFGIHCTLVVVGGLVPAIYVAILQTLSNQELPQKEIEATLVVAESASDPVN